MNKSNISNIKFTYIWCKIKYLNVKTSNIFTIATTINWITIDTATRDPIEWTTIGGIAGATSNIDTISITTITITITITLITITTTITIVTIITTTITTSVINIITSDTGAGVSELRIR